MKRVHIILASLLLMVLGGLFLVGFASDLCSVMNENQLGEMRGGTLYPCSKPIALPNMGCLEYPSPCECSAGQTDYTCFDMIYSPECLWDNDAEHICERVRLSPAYTCRVCAYWSCGTNRFGFSGLTQDCHGATCPGEVMNYGFGPNTNQEMEWAAEISLSCE